MKFLATVAKVAIGVTAIALGAEKLGSVACDVKEDIKAKRKAKENNEPTETEE